MPYVVRQLYLNNPEFETPVIRAAMDSFFTSWQAKHALPEKVQLYHYTTLGGMQGIIKDRTLWCTHTSSFNDRSEIQYGQEIMAGVIQEAMQREDRADLRNFLKKVLMQVQGFNKAMFHVFVACFCGSGNILSQWRAYAGGGGGYCLGFEFSANTRINSNLAKPDEGWSPNLRKIVYDEAEQRALVDGYLQSVLQAARVALDSSISQQFRAGDLYPSSVMAFQAADTLMDMLLSFKHPAFKSEEEWRMVRVTRESDDPEGLEFREEAGVLIPYRPTYIYDKEGLDEYVFPLRSVGFGPMLEHARTRSAIDLLLHHVAADKHPIKLKRHLVQINGPGYSLRQD